MLAVHDNDEPKNVNEAITSHASEYWIKANRMAKVLYVNAVESLMCAICVQVQVFCNDVGLVNRYQSNPGYKHWNTVKRFMTYLRLCPQ